MHIRSDECKNYLNFYKKKETFDFRFNPLEINNRSKTESVDSLRSKTIRLIWRGSRHYSSTETGISCTRISLRDIHRAYFRLSRINFPPPYRAPR